MTVRELFDREQVSYYDVHLNLLYVFNFHRFPFVKHNVLRIAEIICFSWRVIWLIGKRGCHATVVRKFRAI